MKRLNKNNELPRLVESYVDGELSDADLELVQNHLAENGELSGLQSALTEMGDLLRMSVEHAADNADLDTLWTRIDQQLTEESVVEAIPFLQLQAFVDGELHGKAATDVASMMVSRADDCIRMEALSEMGDLLRMSVESAAGQVDFDQLWSKLDAEVGAEIEAASVPAKAQHTDEPRESWFQRFLGAIGGYRAMAMSAVTAALVAIMLIPFMGGSDVPDQNAPAPVEIRVVHVNEVRSSPGHTVTVDSASGVAPVIYITPDNSVPDDHEAQEPNDGDESDAVFNGPI